MREIIKRIQNVISESTANKVLEALAGKIDELKVLVARTSITDMRRQGICEDIHDAEFRVFSQFGDDGIIQYLIHNMDIPSKTFIEFGVQTYVESNTRFLLMNNNWKGLVIEGDQASVDLIRRDDIYWRHDLTAVNEFVTKENINRIFTDNGFTGEIGLLSIDIDGNDYWIWECIDAVDPVIVIVEYNSVFGPRHAVTVPYRPDFVRTSAHYSNLYWGASLKAFCLLGEKKGYCFAGCNSNGNNAYFIRKDRIGNLRALSADEGYVESRFRESRDKEGRLTYVSGPERLKLIENMIVHDIETGRERTIKSLKGES